MSDAFSVVFSVVTEHLIGPIAVLGVGAFVSRRVGRKVDDVQAGQRETAEVTKAVHEQVANDHESNLREDVDGVRDRVISVEMQVGEVRSSQDETLQLVRGIDQRQVVTQEQVRTLFNQFERLADRFDHHVDRPRD